ncbi:metallophosphoesterase [Mucisphaera calidilacus]|uniref:Calcineurin-like phosphoesterase n=1 Tax=Mucisphaera calidilacus TaxID=2527982 RepID=A0A518BY40_9BACT|nr:metallophosphoesterase [Mucisphaera calidilacus]QDU71882.1 Calcineurin-like phosphoesterase [Mucisphaera calidilacus]
MSSSKLSCALIAACVSSLAATDTASAEAFSLVALPDTQFYSRYRPASQYLNFENPYLTQMNWLVDNAAARNIAFTIHLGDVVDQSWVEEEWVFADQMHQILDDADINYGVARGNHDLYGDSFVTHFGPHRFADMPTYQGSDPSGINSYHVFEGGGREFLVLFTDWRNSAEEIAWFQSVLDANPDKPTILVSHEILGPNHANPDQPNVSGNGQLLWDEIIADNDQIFMTLNGHNQGNAKQVVLNNHGNEVIQILADYQFNPFNGTGYLLELTFDDEANTIEANTFSPWITAANEAGIVIPPFFNVPEELTDPAARFVYEVNFDERFGVVPEPASLALLTLGALGTLRRR